MRGLQGEARGLRSRRGQEEALVRQVREVTRGRDKPRLVAKKASDDSGDGDESDLEEDDESSPESPNKRSTQSSPRKRLKK